MNSEEFSQRALCQKWKSPFCPAKKHLKAGIARNVKEDVYPINGMRHTPTIGTSGWYIWAGEELDEDDDFFLPVHLEHLDDWCPLVKKYLGLAPGWRFLLAPDYEDVWFDSSLLTN